MITAFVWILVICVVVALLHWAVTAMGTPEPLARIVRVGSIVLACLFILLIILQLFGMSTGIDLPDAQVPRP